MSTKFDEIKRQLMECTPEERAALFAYLRREFPIHPIETELNVQAEVILEAIHRASDLSLRGVRGLIAEASFEFYVARNLDGWKMQVFEGDFPYDFLLSDKSGSVRVQVKMQRLERKLPKVAKRDWQFEDRTVYVVETQKTRGGIDAATGEKTRPYRFGEFDILAVSMHPSTNDWSTFMYTVSRWLLETPNDARLINTFQPVHAVPDEVWTDDFLTCVRWLRSNVERKIWVPSSEPGDRA